MRCRVRREADSDDITRSGDGDGRRLIAAALEVPKVEDSRAIERAPPYFRAARPIELDDCKVAAVPDLAVAVDTTCRLTAMLRYAGHQHIASTIDCNSPTPVASACRPVDISPPERLASSAGQLCDHHIAVRACVVCDAGDCHIRSPDQRKRQDERSVSR